MSTETEEVPDYELAKRELNALFDSLKLDHEIHGPVPSVEDDWPHLMFTLRVKGINFQYRMGVGHVKREAIKKAITRADYYGELESAIYTIYKHGWALKDKNTMAQVAFRLWDKKYNPTIADIIGSVARDAEAHDMSFEEWCSYYGYDSDSIKAKDIYEYCVASWHNLRKIGLSAEQISKIARIASRL